jgi:hypothetical protein
MKRNAVVLSLLLLALPALGAGSIDALRATQRSTREQLLSLKSEQLARRNELSQVSQRIEQLKADTRGKLLPGGELDAALKRSQELSSTLTGLAAQSSTHEGELESANLALLAGLTDELGRLRADFDRQTDRPARAKLIGAMKSLRQERDALRASLPAAKVPVLVPLLDALKPSDDPETLLEQADLLRDNEEKLQKELKALDTRIGERRQEVELDRRVQRFMGEESMFDDQDRRLRVQHTQPAADSVANATGGISPKDGTIAGSPAPSTPTLGPQGAVDPAASGLKVTNGSDAQAQVGGPRALGASDDDLGQLERERAKLAGLREQMAKKAAELEKRAGELK